LSQYKLVLVVILQFCVFLFRFLFVTDAIESFRCVNFHPNSMQLFSCVTFVGGNYSFFSKDLFLLIVWSFFTKHTALVFSLPLIDYFSLVFNWSLNRVIASIMVRLWARPDWALLQCRFKSWSSIW
jgi:hypothetical protein